MNPSRTSTQIGGTTTSHGRRQRPEVQDGPREERREEQGIQGQPARGQQEGHEHPVQNLHADLHLHNL